MKAELRFLIAAIVAVIPAMYWRIRGREDKVQTWAKWLDKRAGF